MNCGEKELSPEIPPEVIEFAQELAQNPYFQNIFEFTLDVGQTPKGLRLIEVNGFETASFYAANLHKVYQAWAESFQNLS